MYDQYIKVICIKEAHELGDVSANVICAKKPFYIKLNKVYYAYLIKKNIYVIHEKMDNDCYRYIGSYDYSNFMTLAELREKRINDILND